MGNIKVPETLYAQSGEVSIAYQVFGNGSRDLVYVPGIISHLELYWQDPSMAEWLTQLGQHFRVIILDKRGQGMSDRIESSATLEDRIDDVNAVMEAAQSTRALRSQLLVLASPAFQILALLQSKRNRHLVCIQR